MGRAAMLEALGLLRWLDEELRIPRLGVTGAAVFSFYWNRYARLIDQRLPALQAAILAPLTDKETGALAWAATRVRVSKAGGKGELMLFAGGMKEHDARQR